MKDQSTPDVQQSATDPGPEPASPRLRAEVASLQRQLAQAQGQLEAMRTSRSWRVTRPLRWCGEQWRALRDQGLLERVRRLVARLSRRLGHLSPRRAVAGELPCPPGSEVMSVPARRVHDRLQFVMAMRLKKDR